MLLISATSIDNSVRFFGGATADPQRRNVSDKNGNHQRKSGKCSDAYPDLGPHGIAPIIRNTCCTSPDNSRPSVPITDVMLIAGYFRSGIK